MARLTDKQKRFVAEYLVDLNATQAAKRAGYKDPNIGRQLITKNNVSAAIQKAMSNRETRTEITQDKVLEELARVAFANGTVFARVVSKNGFQAVELVNIEDVPAEKRSAIAAIKEGKYGIEVSSYDEVRALELLGRHLGLFDGKGQTKNEVHPLVSDLVAAMKERQEGGHAE